MLNKFLIKTDIQSFTKCINGRKIAIWGASTGGGLVFDILNEMGFNVDVFIDNNFNKQKSLFKERLIYGPDYLENKVNNHYIFVAMNYYSEIENLLNQSGYNFKKDYYLLRKQITVIEDVGKFLDWYGNEIVGTPSANLSKVIFKGNGNKLVFGSGVNITKCTIEFSSNDGFCFIGDNSLYKGYIKVGKESKIIIGKNLEVSDNCLLWAAEQTEIKIGNDCMFASHNQIRSGDGHPIFDVKTGERVNPGYSIMIGDHVWLADFAVLLNKSSIAEGSVIGHSSIVKSQIPNNCIAVGSPARVIKKNITWEKINTSHFNFYAPYSSPDDENISDKRYWQETID